MLVCLLHGWASQETRGQILGAPPQHVTTSPNFVIYANDPQWSKQVSQYAEDYRKNLAKHWLGIELPAWSKPCILIVQDNPRALASGETNYTLLNGAVINFKMTVRGTRERILDSVLPHEITHTVVASHFAPLGKPVPRWADEGMCTTVEHSSERQKHDQLLVKYLNEDKGLPFATLFLLEDYPADPLPLYAQGYSLTSFLIAQGGGQGPRTFIKFLEKGMQTNDWVGATKDVYGYPLVGKLQTAWNAWVNNGGNEVAKFTAEARGFGTQSMVAMLNRPTAEGIAALPVSATQPTRVATNNNNNNATNKTMPPSSPEVGSYYLEQLRQQQGQSAGTGSENPVRYAPIGSPTRVASNTELPRGNNGNPSWIPSIPQATTEPQGTERTVGQSRPMETVSGSLVR
jgi:hypothetical protein